MSLRFVSFRFTTAFFTALLLTGFRREFVLASSPPSSLLASRGKIVSSPPLDDRPKMPGAGLPPRLITPDPLKPIFFLGCFAIILDLGQTRPLTLACGDTRTGIGIGVCVKHWGACDFDFFCTLNNNIVSQYCSTLDWHRCRTAATTVLVMVSRILSNNY